MFQFLFLTFSFCTVVATTNEIIFKKALTDLSVDMSDKNYLHLMDRLTKLSYNQSCTLITRDGKCLTLQETKETTITTIQTTIPTTIIPEMIPTKTKTIQPQRRQTATTLKPLNIAKKFIFELLKVVAPKSQLAQNVYKNSQTNNITATKQFLMGTTLSNSILLNKINTKISLNQNIAKGSSIVTLLMFVFSLIGTVVYCYKKYQTYKIEKKQRKNQLLEEYYMRRRNLDNRVSGQRLAIEES